MQILRHKEDEERINRTGTKQHDNQGDEQRPRDEIAECEAQPSQKFAADVAALASPYAMRRWWRVDRQNREEGDHKRERIGGERDANAEGHEEQRRHAEADQ